MTSRLPSAPPLPSSDVDESRVLEIIAKEQQLATNRFYRGAKSIYRWFMIIGIILWLMSVIVTSKVPVLIPLAMILAAIQIFVAVKLTDDYCD